MNDTRISLDNDDIRKVLWHLKQLSPFAEGSSSKGSISSSVIANKFERMEGKHVFRYSLERSKRAKTLPTKTSVKLSSKDETKLFRSCYFKG